MSPIRPSDLILLLTERGRRYLLELHPGREFHCQAGRLSHDDLIGQQYGSRVMTERGQWVVPLQPSTSDLVMHLRRRTQIVYPKEIGYLLLWMDIRPGKRVIEAGTGSGAMTVALAQHVQPTGRVYSYELREDFQEVARQNLERYGLLHWVSLKLQDISQGFEERDADALFLDVREPWDYLEQAQAALKGGGFFGSLVPTVNQLSRLIDGLERAGFMGTEVKELLLRPYKVNASRLRPEDRMVAHTGYLALARAPYQSVSSHRPTASDLARLSREDLLARLVELIRGFMVTKARRRRRRRRPVLYQ
jgi:tRNA (adenine57-N1/adenine58-N1)-methyltransferase